MSAAEALPLELAPTDAGRVPDDFYATPSRDVEAFLDTAGLNVRGLSVFEPSAGDGAILDVCRGRGAERLLGLELEERRAAVCRAKGYDVTTADAMERTWGAADLLLGNPPFTMALEFAELAAAWAHRNGKPAALLLRLAFLESRKRAHFHASCPSDIFVLSERPSFRRDRKGTDSSAYAWFVWGPLASRRWTVIPPKEPV
jgi:hypothetical protein